MKGFRTFRVPPMEPRRPGYDEPEGAEDPRVDLGKDPGLDRVAGKRRAPAAAEVDLGVLGYRKLLGELRALEGLRKDLESNVTDDPHGVLVGIAQRAGSVSELAVALVREAE